MQIRGWWSRTGEVLVSIDPDTARRIEGVITTEQGTGEIVDPTLVQLRDQLRSALREGIAGT